VKNIKNPFIFRFLVSFSQKKIRPLEDAFTLLGFQSQEELHYGIESSLNFVCNGGFFTGGAIGIYKKPMPSFSFLRLLRACGGGVFGGATFTIASFAGANILVNMINKDKK
jgi:hypothetical protein